MSEMKTDASVTVEKTAAGWHVRAVDNGETTEQAFETREEAEAFASSRRLLTGQVPQPDLA